MSTESIEFIVDEGGAAGRDEAVGSACRSSHCVAAMQPSMAGNLAYANHVASNDLGAKSQLAHQDAMNRLRQTIIANAVARVQDTDPVAARSAVVALTSDALARQIAGLKAVVQTFAAAP